MEDPEGNTFAIWQADPVAFPPHQADVLFDNQQNSDTEVPVGASEAMWRPV